MQIQTLTGLSMGGTWCLRIAAGAAPRTIVQATLDLVEAQMSAWKPTSDLCRINNSPLGVWVTVPAEIVHVIGAGLALMQFAPTAFSILMGGAQARYGFVPGRACEMSNTPDHLELAGHRVRRHADIAVDLNALAKGFAADLVVLMLTKAGYDSFLIEVAGDIKAQGLRPDGLPWTVALELPIPDQMIAARFLPLHNSAIATSGGYRRAKGAFSHLLSPVTGLPLPASAASCAVLAPSAMVADGWATVLAVLGPDLGLAFATSQGLAAILIEPHPDGFVERGSPAMDQLLDAAKAA